MNFDQIAFMEEAWLNRVPPVPGCFGWEPYDLEAFNSLLGAAVELRPGASFLDAGCGVGTKVLLAQQAGLEAYGVDLIPDFLEAARLIGVDVYLGDVRDWDYSRYGVVYVNHPLIDQDKEAELERSIHEAMAQDAVLIAVNYGIAPDWPEIARTGEWAAAWVKQ